MTVAVNADNRPKIEAAFWEFHNANPDVYAELKRIALDLIDRGYTKFGIATVYEVARWRSMLRLGPSAKFKLNNNFRAYYARMLMDREPRLAGVFDTRRLGVPSHVAP